MGGPGGPAIPDGLGHWERRLVVSEGHDGYYSVRLEPTNGVWGTVWVDAAPTTTAIVCVWVIDSPQYSSD